MAQAHRASSKMRPCRAWPKKKKIASQAWLSLGSDAVVCRMRRVGSGGSRPGAAIGWRRRPEEEGINHFDRLLDSMILVIFNRIGDVKALGWCCIVSRRFHSLIPPVDCVISDDLAPSTAGGGADDGAGPDKGRGVFSHLTRLVLGGLVKPLKALGQILAPASSLSSAASRRSFASSSSSSCSSSEVSHHSPTEVLKNFKEICRLRIEIGVDDDILLKWKADFGSTLDSFIILGTSSVLSSSLSSSLSHPADDAIGPKYLWAMSG